MRNVNNPERTFYQDKVLCGDDIVFVDMVKRQKKIFFTFWFRRSHFVVGILVHNVLKLQRLFFLTDGGPKNGFNIVKSEKVL